jgi:hypothetical protein
LTHAFRLLLVTLASLMATACFYRSDIDLAPMADRVPRAVVPAGDYCEATASSPPYIVKSSEDCERIGWDQATRTYAVAGDEEGEEPRHWAPVAVGGNLYALQNDDGEESEAGRYHLMLVLANKSAFFVLPTLTRDKITALAAKHPGITLTQREDADPIITAGEPAAIKAFLMDAAREALRGANLEDEELSIAIRDRAGAPDHEANGMQTMAIIELVTAIFALQGQE